MNIRDYVMAKLSIWGVTVQDTYIDIELQKVGLIFDAEATAELNTDEFFYNIILISDCITYRIATNI